LNDCSGAECLEYVRARATPGDANSVVKFFDEFAYQNWMMNIGDVKGEIVDAEIAKAKPQVCANAQDAPFKDGYHRQPD
jgi:catechol O-methyltransferase